MLLVLCHFVAADCQNHTTIHGPAWWTVVNMYHYFNQSINQFISLHTIRKQHILPLWEMMVPIHLIFEGFKKIDTYLLHIPFSSSSQSSSKQLDILLQFCSISRIFTDIAIILHAFYGYIMIFIDFSFKHCISGLFSQ